MCFLMTPLKKGFIIWMLKIHVGTLLKKSFLQLEEKIRKSSFQQDNKADQTELNIHILS